MFDVESLYNISMRELTPPRRLLEFLTKGNLLRARKRENDKPQESDQDLVYRTMDEFVEAPVQEASVTYIATGKLEFDVKGQPTNPPTILRLSVDRKLLGVEDSRVRTDSGYQWFVIYKENSISYIVEVVGKDPGYDTFHNPEFRSKQLQFLATPEMKHGRDPNHLFVLIDDAAKLLSEHGASTHTRQIDVMSGEMRSNDNRRSNVTK